MADVLEFLMLDAAGAHWQSRSRAFQCLNTGHLIDRDRLDAGLGPFRGKSIGLADIVTFRFKALIVLCGQPTPHAMRLQAGIFLKSARRHVGKWIAQCRV